MDFAWSISFWKEDIKYKFTFRSKECRLDEILKCVEEQYKK